MAGQEGLRAAAARDKNFLGIDIAAMAQLIHQMNAASNAIGAWLRTNASLPPGVPRTGVRQAAAVHTWVSGQPGMLTRRRNYAVTHLGKRGHDMPRVSPGDLGRQRHHTTPAGAGRHVGHFPDVHAATKAGAIDGAAVQKALKAHRPPPPEVWTHLRANADDPDYTRGLYDRLGPAGAADLIKAALHDKAHLTAVESSLGVGSHHVPMGEKWLRAMLDEAARDGVRDDAVHLLHQAGLARRTKVALGHLGLTHMIEQPGRHRIPAPRPPHEAMILTAATDPHAAVELYSRHPETVHRALTGCPRSPALEQLVAHATTTDGTAHDIDPAAVRANADRLAGFRAGARQQESGHQ